MDLSRGFIQKLALVLLVFFYTLALKAEYANEIETEFLIIQEFAEKGDYSAGLFYTKNLKNRIVQESGEQSLDYLELSYYFLRFNYELSKQEEYQLNLTEFQLLYDQFTVQKSNEKRCLSITLNLVELFFLQGKCESSLPFLEKFKDKFTEGSYEAIRLNTSLFYAEYMQGKLNTSEGHVDLEIKKIKSLCLKDSLEKHFELYSSLMEIKVLILLEQGLETQAVKTLEEHEDQLLAGLKKRPEYPSRIYYYKGIVEYKKGEFRSAEKLFKKASGISRFYYFGHHIFVTDIQKFLCKSLLAQGKLEEADYYNNLTDVNVVGYFGRKSLPYWANNYKDIERELHNGYWEKAEASILNFLEKELLPGHHKLREHALKDLVLVMDKNLNFKGADSVLTLLAEEQAELYGKEAPVIYLTELQGASHTVRYDDDFEDANMLYYKYPETLMLEELKASNPNYLEMILNKIELYTYLEWYDYAKETLERNCKLLAAQKGNQCPEYAILRTEYSSINLLIGNFKVAEQSIEEAFNILNKDKSTDFLRHRIRTLEVKANISMQLGANQEVEELISLINTMLKSENVNEDIYLTEDIGSLYIQAGRYQEAQRLLEDLLEHKIGAYGPNHKELISIYNALSTLNIEQGNYHEAEYFLKESLEISEKVFSKNSLVYSEGLMVQKKLFDALGDNKNSAIAIENVLSITKRLFGDDNFKVGVILNESVVVKSKIGGYNKDDLELDLYYSLGIIEKAIGVNSPGYAFGLENTARFYLINNSLDRALIELRAAAAIWDNIAAGENVSVARVNMLMGRVQQKKKEYSPAYSSFIKAKGIYKKLFNDNHPGYIAALGKCAQLEYCLGATEQSVRSIKVVVEKSLNYINIVFPLLSERGKSAFWELISEDFEFYKSIVFKHADEYSNLIPMVLNLQLQTRSILLNSTLKLKRKVLASGNEEAIAAYKKMVAERELVARVYSMSESKRKEQGYDVSAIEHNVEKYEKALVANFSEFKTERDQDYSWKNLKSYLRSDEVLVEIIPFRYYDKEFTDSVWYAFIALDAGVKKGRDIKYSIIKDGHLLESYHKAMYRNSIKFEFDDERSYHSFWKPIASIIGENKKTILIVNDGVYNQINLETIQTPDGDFLIDRYNFVSISTGRDLISREDKQKEQINTKSISLYGNPHYYVSDTINKYSFFQLPGAEKEVKKIGSFLSENGWDIDLRIYDEAGENDFKNVENYTVVHIGTHGYYLPEKKNDYLGTEGNKTNPLLRSGLLFRGGGDVLSQNSMASINSNPGVLTAYEAMNLSLDNTELVVLSACETGLGDVKKGEGVMGLHRAFLVAGGKTIIMSLFEVSDEITERLMLLFYQNWIGGLDKHEAFLEAKRTIMKETRYPIYWGAFIMTGIN